MMAANRFLRLCRLAGAHRMQIDFMRRPLRPEMPRCASAKSNRRGHRSIRADSCDLECCTPTAVRASGQAQSVATLWMWVSVYHRLGDAFHVQVGVEDRVIQRASMHRRRRQNQCGCGVGVEALGRASNFCSPGSRASSSVHQRTGQLRTNVLILRTDRTVHERRKAAILDAKASDGSHQSL